VPRRRRVDAPGQAHHVIIRGVNKRRIFLDAHDYLDFLLRLDRLIPELGFRCFAWVLMPNHVHLALQTGPVPLYKLMARLGTGYAGSFNRRYERLIGTTSTEFGGLLNTDNQVTGKPQHLTTQGGM